MEFFRTSLNNISNYYKFFYLQINIFNNYCFCLLIIENKINYTMRKFTFLLLTLFCFAALKADGVPTLAKADAENAVEFLEEQQEVILFCACCDDSKLTKVFISWVHTEPTNIEGQYQLMIEGTDINSKPIKETVDVTQLFFIVGNKAYSVSQALGLDADPCTGPFKL